MRPDQEEPADPLTRTQAFEDFYLRHFDMMTRFVARRIANPHTVADLTAEIFLAALHSRRTYRPGRGSETGWLYGVARNVLLPNDAAASARRAPSNGSSRAGCWTATISPTLPTRIDAEEPARRALSAMADLPEGERALLELVVIDQLTVAEAAQALNLWVGTARVRLHRTRRTLRKVPGVAAALVTEGL